MAESNHRGYPSIGANRLCGLLFSITPAAAMSPFAQAQAQGKDSQKTTLQQVTGHDELFSEVDPSYSGELAKPEGPNNPTGQENNHPGVEKTASLRDSLIALAERLADDSKAVGATAGLSVNNASNSFGISKEMLRQVNPYDEYYAVCYISIDSNSAAVLGEDASLFSVGRQHQHSGAGLDEASNGAKRLIGGKASHRGSKLALIVS